MGSPQAREEDSSPGKAATLLKGAGLGALLGRVDVGVPQGVGVDRMPPTVEESHLAEAVDVHTLARPVAGDTEQGLEGVAHLALVEQGAFLALVGDNMEPLAWGEGGLLACDPGRAPWDT